MKTLYHSALMATLLFLSTSCLKQDKGQFIPGINGPKVNVQNGKILLTVELLGVDAGAGVTMPLPKMKNSNFTVSPSMADDGSLGGTLLKVNFDLKDVESDNFRVVPENTLPDGRDFPFMVDGTLPAIAFNVPKFKDSTFYASNKLFGFFLPITLPEEFQTSVHYRIKINKKNYGIVSLIHPDQYGNGAGVIVLLTLDEIRKNPEFKKLLKYSKKKRNRLF